MSRSLGDGRIAEILKTYAYIEDDRLGRVFFPIAAVINQNCYDLRSKFKTGDHVIFTALKQVDIKNSCAYVACSVVESNELKEKTGKISERFDKFCYVDLPREGRIFVPYSARNAIGKSWLGRGSEVGVTVTVKYFCQPVINDCNFVAFTCEVRESVNPAMKPVASQGGAHRSPEFVHEQIGCIVVWNGAGGECQVYSSVTGLASLPIAIIQPYMALGTWIKYIAQRNNYQGENSRLGWIVNNPQDLGTLFESIPYSMDTSRLQLEVGAVVNRVDKKTRAAWMWNDHIGRIYVPPLYFRPTLRPFDSVKIVVCYTGHFEDVPWSAVKISELGEDERVREESALMLNTCDTWKVSHVQMAAGTFYSFLEHSTYGSAFAAWTDYTAGETPPKQGMQCRVTVYRQERDKKHIYRAVMVTPLDPSTHQPTHHHPSYSPGKSMANGLSIPLPRAWKEPLPPSAPASRPFSPPGINGTRGRLPSAGSAGGYHPLSMSEVVSGVRRRQITEPAGAEDLNGGIFTPPPSQISHFNGFHSNGVDLSPVIGNGGGSHYGGSRDSPAASSVHPSLSESSDLFGPLGGSDEMAFERSIASPAASDSLLHRSDPNSYFSVSNVWEPLVEGGEEGGFLSTSTLGPGPGYRPPKTRNGSFSTSTSVASTADAETQTDIMNEHKVLRDIMANTNLLVKLFEVLPQHVETFMNMSTFVMKIHD